MQTNSSARVWIVSAAMALTTTMVGTASQNRAAEESERSRPAITGSWMVTVTPAGGSPFSALETYGEGGALVANTQGGVIMGPFPFPASYTTLHGQWTYQGGRTFSATMVQIGSDLNDGHVLLAIKVRQTVTLSKSGNAYRAVFKAEFSDPAGSVFFVLEGTSEARRIVVEPLN